MRHGPTFGFGTHRASATPQEGRMEGGRQKAAPLPSASGSIRESDTRSRASDLLSDMGDSQTAAEVPSAKRARTSKPVELAEPSSGGGASSSTTDRHEDLVRIGWLLALRQPARLPGLQPSGCGGLLGASSLPDQPAARLRRMRSKSPRSWTRPSSRKRPGALACSSCEHACVRSCLMLSAARVAAACKAHSAD